MCILMTPPSLAFDDIAVAHRQNRVVRKFAHDHIAILAASSYSDDVIAIEVKKIEKSLSDFSNFLR